MQWLKTCLSLFLSFAILFVGSAAAAASVHKKCLMSSEKMQSMQMMHSPENNQVNAAHMDCMKADSKIKKITVHDSSCMSEPDCIASFAKIAFPKDTLVPLPEIAGPLLDQSNFTSPNQQLPPSILYSLWRPPQAT